MTYDTRPQAYDETIRILEKKDHRGIAEFVLPCVKDAKEISIETASLSIPDMREADFLVTVSMDDEDFILHIEFEAAYSSNVHMQKRMLRYYTYIKWHTELPIYQVLAILKKPDKVKHIIGGFRSTVQGLDVMQYQYKVIKLYEIDKYEVLNEKKTVLYPLRVFMDHPNETEEEHIEECLGVVEQLDDKDYYFLTLQCLKKLYEKSEYQQFVKEEILMQSTIYREPYEKGKLDGILMGELKGKQEGKLEGKQEGKLEGKQEGKLEGKLEGEAKMVIKVLTRRFGVLPLQFIRKIEASSSDTLDRIMDESFDYKSIDEVFRDQ